MIYEMGWGRDEKAAEGRRKIFVAAVRNHVTHFAPCSTSWERVRRERPDLELAEPAGQSPSGNTWRLPESVLFLSPRSPGTQPRGPSTGSDDLAAPERRRKEGCRVHRGNRCPSTNMTPKLPKWMKRLVVTAELQSIDVETAKYVQRVAWEEYQRAQNRLTGATERWSFSRKHLGT